MTAVPKTKYVMIFMCHVLIVIFVGWADYWLIEQGVSLRDFLAPAFLRMVMLVVLNVVFCVIALHQSRNYLRLYAWVAFFNRPVLEVFGKFEDVSTFTMRDNLPTSIIFSSEVA